MKTAKFTLKIMYIRFWLILARSAEEKDGQKARVAVLTGEARWYAGTSWLFIRGAMMVENMEVAADHIDFTDEIWQKIHEEQGKYFAEQEVAGWFFSQPQIPVESSEIFARVHHKHFGGEKVLMIINRRKRKMLFFVMKAELWKSKAGIIFFMKKIRRCRHT